MIATDVWGISLLADAGHAALPLIVGGALALLFLVLSLRAGRRQRLIDNVPTSKTSGVFIGLVELTGTAESSQPLRSHLAEIPCVCFQWSVEEHWSRTVTERYTDSKGKRRTRTRHESGWKTVADGGLQQPFYLKDDRGIVLVRPEGAKVEQATVFSERCHRGDWLYYAKGPAHSVSDSDHRRRFTERAVPLHAKLYVMGKARERQDVVAPEIAAAPDTPMFLISTRDERQISGGLALQYWLFGVLGALAVGAGGTFSASMGSRAAGEPDLAAGLGLVGGFAGLWVLGWLWMAYNSMVHLRQMVTQAWSNVDVQLRRRADLIPNLVEAVKGLRGHERTVQESLALLRSQALATRPGQAGADPVATSPAVMALAESYPQLKADDAFRRLQRQLADTEDRIALAREYFNNIASHYNRRLAIVPDCYVASLAGLGEQPLFAAAGFERRAVKVDLAD